MAGTVEIAAQAPDSPCGQIRAARLEALLDEFCKALAMQGRRQTTVLAYRKAIRQYAAHTGGRERLCAESAARWRDSLIAQGRSVATAQLYLVALRSLAGWAASRGLIPEDDAASLRRVSPGRIKAGFRRDCLSEDQAAAMLAGVDRSTLTGKRDYALLCLMTFCGLRDCEISRARVRDLGYSDGCVTLYVHGKGHDAADDRVKPGPGAERALREYLDARGAPGPDEPLFASHSNRNARGLRMDPSSVSRIARRYVRSVRMPGQRISPHSLRHTAATSALRSGRPLQEVQAMMRHRDINTTMIYSHNMEFASRQAESAAESAILGRLP